MKNRRFWDFGLALGSFLAFILVLTGNFFLSFSPLKSPFLLLILLAILIPGYIYRFTWNYSIGFSSRIKLLPQQVLLKLPFLILLISFVLNGFLRYQTLQKNPNFTAPERDLAISILTIVKRSDWRPLNYSQPPVYLFTQALLAEALSIQGAGNPDGVPIDELKPETYLTSFRLLNLIFGVLTIIPLYLAGSLLAGKLGGATSSLLFAGEWVSYQVTPNLAPPLLAGFLGMLAFYFLIKNWKEGNERLFSWAIAGCGLGLALGAAYGNILLVLPLVGVILGFNKHKLRNLGISILSLMCAFTLAVPGWIFDLPRFLNGLALLGQAPAGALSFYFRELAGHDPGILFAFGAALALVAGFGTKPRWLAISFPLAYLISLAFLGPPAELRLALVGPFLALVSALPIMVLSNYGSLFLKRKGLFETSGVLAFGFALLLLLAGVLARRG